jgi:hypothetical protein
MRAVAIAMLAAACQSPQAAAPRGLLDGWDRLAYKDGACELYVPRSRAELPAPFTWEPCPEAAGAGCRRIALDWARNPKLPEWIAPATLASRDGRGALLLHTARYQAGGTLRMIAEVDGPVRIALREQDERCALGAAASDGDHYAFRVYDSEATGELDSYGGGGIGGALDELTPRVLVAAHDRIARSVFAGAPGFLELAAGGAMTLHPWAGAPVALWSSERGGGLAQNFQSFRGGALLWAANDEATRKQMVWTASGGVKELLPAAADLGTDGKDLVWLEGTRNEICWEAGCNTASQPGGFADIRVVAAPFTTDPARVKPRVVRANGSPHPFGTSPFVVGCGRAARATFVDDGGARRHAIEVIRLSDGATWHLPDAPGSAWGYRAPLALTCDEIFARVYERTPGQPGHFNVARVRLDGFDRSAARVP